MTNFLHWHLWHTDDSLRLLELPSIITLHSRLVGDVFFHQAAPADPPALCA
ncbi:MAG TPA: hypothetical protein VKZ89_09480 [Thermobifida alba]|nr:hypothetical protein [Thermobifida alba]